MFFYGIPSGIRHSVNTPIRVIVGIRFTGNKNRWEKLKRWQWTFSSLTTRCLLFILVTHRIENFLPRRTGEYIENFFVIYTSFRVQSVQNFSILSVSTAFSRPRSTKTFFKSRDKLFIYLSRETASSLRDVQLKTAPKECPRWQTTLEKEALSRNRETRTKEPSVVLLHRNNNF